MGPAAGAHPPNDIVTLEDGVLTLSGARTESGADDGRSEPQYRRTERRQGTFYRRFVFPDTADSENVKAAGKNGVLAVTIRKQAKSQPRRIQIAG